MAAAAEAVRRRTLHVHPCARIHAWPTLELLLARAVDDDFITVDFEKEPEE